VSKRKQPQMQKRPKNYKAEAYTVGYRAGYHAGYQIGYEAGVTHSGNTFGKYLLPLRDAVEDLNAAGAYIAGVVNAGHGELPRAILVNAGEELGTAMAALTLRSSDAVGVGFHLDPQISDLSVAQKIFEAVNNFLQNKLDTGENLRQLFAGLSPILKKDRELWHELRPGAPKQDIIDRLCYRARPYRESDEIVMSWGEIYDRLMTDLDHIAKRTTEENEEFDKLEKWGAENLRKAYNDRYPVPSLTGRN
jgi:hypothetical protein